MSPRNDDPERVPPETTRDADDPEETKARLQRRVDEARDSISQTVGAIKETVEDQYATARDAVTGVLEWRDEFQQEPIVWSVGALAAGFALGYTLGTAERKDTLASTHEGVGAFADTLVRELATLGTHLPAAALGTIERVVGVDLSKVFSEMSEAHPRRASARPRRRRTKSSRAKTPAAGRRRKR